MTLLAGAAAQSLLAPAPLQQTSMQKLNLSKPVQKKCSACRYGGLCYPQITSHFCMPFAVSWRCSVLSSQFCVQSLR